MKQFSPEIDGRRRDELHEETVKRAREYTPEWDPDSDDVGGALLNLFAEIAEDVTERLDRTPEKHRIAFFDALGFGREPPQSARLPLVFRVAEGVPGNIPIPSGTQAIAEPEEDESEQTFEIAEGEGFEATPALLKEVYSVHPDGDAVFEHQTALQSGDETRLFSGENQQSHGLYIGHTDFFTLAPKTEFEIRIDGPAGVAVFEEMQWQYYGMAEIDGEPVERWHHLHGRPIGTSSQNDESVTLRFSLPETGEFVETTLLEVKTTEDASASAGIAVTELASRWIRCEWPLGPAPDELFEATVTRLTLSLVESADGLGPDMLLANDVPLPTDAQQTADKVFPFGEMPRPLDGFYIASEEAFTKKETRVRIGFVGVNIGAAPGTPEHEGNSDNDRSLDLSWEYWNGSGWAHLPAVDGGFADGYVEFPVPPDAEGTAVGGHDGQWIRARVLEDGYVRYEDEGDVWEMIHDVVPSFERVVIEYDEDSSKAAPDHVVPRNNLDYGEDEAKSVAQKTNDQSVRPLTPFTRLRDTVQTLYVGFDGALDDGPIQLLFSAADKVFPDDFYPRARWEYCEAPATDTWAQLSVEDGTESLTRRGIVSLVFPASTTAFERFGRERHWVRARLIGDQFLAADETASAPSDPSIVISEVDAENERVFIRNTSAQAIDLTGYRLDVEYGQPAKQIRTLPSGSTVPPDGSLVVGTGTKAVAPWDVTLGYDRWVLNDVDPDTVALLTPNDEFVTATEDEREDESGAEDTEMDIADEDSDGTLRPCRTMEPLVLATDPTPTESPPLLRGLYPNAGWADNVRTVTDERLGSSDGSPDQTFSFANAPAIEETVWVEELSVLSEDTRTTLKREQPDGVEERTDQNGDVTAFWVRWTPVKDFVGSAADARHYFADRTAGTLSFGDGKRGRIPPRGADNVRASYRTGGGVNGNVRANAVTALTSALPFVEEITNPEPGNGGADAETTVETLERAPRTLRDRSRAVTRADFERIASTASRELARVRCVPGMDAAGASRAGWVTLLLVPNTQEPRPVPSMEVKERVAVALSERAPAVLTETDRLVVRGPNYVEVSVETTLTVEDTESVSAVEETAIRSIKGFLHPLTGGPTSEGWEFGELPCLSDFYALLEGVTGVDYVTELSLTFRGRDTSVTVTEGESSPDVATEALVCSGTHNVEAEGAGATDVEASEGI